MSCMQLHGWHLIKSAHIDWLQSHSGLDEVGLTQGLRANQIPWEPTERSESESSLRPGST